MRLPTRNNAENQLSDADAVRPPYCGRGERGNGASPRLHPPRARVLVLRFMRIFFVLAVGFALARYAYDLLL
jgi:hypothetical protein